MPYACNVLCAYSFPGEDSDYIFKRGGGGGRELAMMILRGVMMNIFPKSRTRYEGGWGREHKKRFC